MFHRIVVGIDGTSRGRDALTLAVTLASATGAEVTLAHVYAPATIDLPIGSASARPLREAAERLLTEAVRGGPQHARTAAVPGNRPALDLCHFAQEREADLLVIGGSRLGPIGRVLLGDTARAIVRAAHCAVAVAPRDYARGGYHATRVIGLGLDDSRSGRAALAAARDLALRTGAELRIVVALGSELAPPYPFDGFSWERYRADAKAAAEQLLDDAVAQTSSRASGEVSEQPATVALPELSRHCDLMVVGARSSRRLGRPMLGGASDSLMRRARCPVLMVPAQATEETDRDRPLETRAGAA